MFPSRAVLKETLMPKIRPAALALRSGSLALLALAISSYSFGTPESNTLGTVSFRNSCSSDAQPAIAKGVALMHSFQYKESMQTFDEAVRRDPKCPALHWGKAMASYEQIWNFPSDKDLKAGRKEIEKAQKLRSPNPRAQA